MLFVEVRVFDLTSIIYLNLRYSTSTLILGGAGEICSYGHRNPFRCSFDRETDVLYCGDVGQVKVEEVNIIE